MLGMAHAVTFHPVRDCTMRRQRLRGGQGQPGLDAWGRGGWKPPLALQGLVGLAPLFFSFIPPFALPLPTALSFRGLLKAKGG